MISELLLPEFDQEMKNTRKMLERVPESKFAYKPHEKSMTLGQLAGHLAELPSWGAQTLAVEVLEMEAGQQAYYPKSGEDLLAKFDKGVTETRERIAASSDEDFQKTWKFIYAGKEIMSQPRTEVIRGMVISHIIHHRAQLGVYLRLNDVEIPGMYGPSADEMKFWNAQKP